MPRNGEWEAAGVEKRKRQLSLQKSLQFYKFQGTTKLL